MASWLNAQNRARDTQDIRKFIQVHGKIVTPPIQVNSTKQDEMGSDDFSTPQPLSKPTKQLTLMHFKKLSQSHTSKDKAHEQDHGQSNTQRLFLPASKFSTGIRRKVSKKESNKENIQSQDTESAKVLDSDLKGVYDGELCSVSKRTKRKRHPSQLPSPKKLQRRNSELRKKECRINSSDCFLSSRKKTKKHSDEFTEGDSNHSAMDSDIQLQQQGELSFEPNLEDDLADNMEDRVISDSESDEYINTEQLLAELSNCEKVLLNAHTHDVQVQEPFE